MLESRDQYLRAVRVVEALERKADTGQASEFEMRRLEAGREELLCFEWAEEGRRLRKRSIRPALKRQVVVRRDPRSIRFLDWWKRNASRYPDAFWPDAFEFWIEPLNLDATEALELYLDVSAEYHNRWRQQAQEAA